jgi:mRNA interferase MazF
MGQYARGDVVLASLALEDRGVAKTRPAVVIGTGEQDEVWLCPVSSRPSSDAPSVPVSLEDFSQGGLDLFRESYILISRVYRIRCSEVIGKKGRLSGEITAALPARVPTSQKPGNRETRTTQQRPQP